MFRKLVKSAAWSLIFSMLFVANQAVLAQAKCYKFGKEVPCEQLKGLFGWVIALGAVLLLGSMVAFVFWILMLVHAATKPIENKAMWIILMIFTQIIGALIYYFVVKRKFNKQ